MNKFLKLLLLSTLLLGVFSANAETKRALLIGISDYGNEREDPNKWANISGANDIELLSPLFKNQGFQVSTLIDNQATHAGIIKALENLTKNSKNGDIVYIHFSMHGQPFEDLNGDEIDGWDEALIPVDAQMKYKEGVYEGENHLLDDELEVYITKIRTKIGTKGRIYVILDACHSGGSLRGSDDHIRGTVEPFTFSGKRYKSDKTRTTNDYFKTQKKENQSPVLYIEACRSYQTNKEIERPKDSQNFYGPLSYYISEIMGKYNIGESDDWIETVVDKVRKAHTFHKQNVVIEISE